MTRFMTFLLYHGMKASDVDPHRTFYALFMKATKEKKLSDGVSGESTQNTRTKEFNEIFHFFILNSP